MFRIYHISLLLGFIICTVPLFERLKRRILATCYSAEKRTKLESFLFPGVFGAWIRLDYLRAANSKERESLKALVMGGSGGRDWAKYYDSQPIDFNTKTGDISFSAANPFFEKIETLCLQSDSVITIIQLGCSSGREIAYLAKRFPQHQFIGTDLYPEVIEYSAEAHRHENLSFQVSSAQQITDVINNTKTDRIILFSSCSMQYLDPDDMRSFFKTLSKYKNIYVLINEPVDGSKFLPPQRFDGSLWRGSFSYTHDYKAYAEAAGLHIDEMRLIYPYKPDGAYSSQRNTAHYFLVCHS